MKRVDLRELDTLLSDDRIVFIACLAHWSPESRMVEPVFDELACEFAADVTVVAVIPTPRSSSPLRNDGM